MDTEVVALPADPFVDTSKNPYSTTAIACDTGHPHHHGGRRDTTIKDPVHDDPVNYKSREDWQRALQKSKIDPDAKRYIKQLENTIVDGWEQTFDTTWERIEEALDRGLPVTDELFVEYLTEAARKQVQNLDKDSWTSAFNGLYVRGREQSDLNGKNKRKAQRVDTLEEQAVLARLRQTSLEKVTTITRQDLRDDILEELSKPGARAKSPTAIANEIIRMERARLEEQIEDRKLLREQIRSLYDDQLWKIQRITRTEASNAYTLSVLKGYQEQGIQKVKWNSHTDEQGTCSICLTYDGTEFDVDELLTEGGRYPLSTQSHPQCRCWFTPIISHVTLEYMEELYENEPELFAPGQTVFDKAILEMEDVVKEYQEYYGVGIRDVPIENADEVKETLSIIRETPYQELQPDELRFVKDVGATEEF